jgi:hypothetical protein
MRVEHSKKQKRDACRTLILHTKKRRRKKQKRKRKKKKMRVELSSLSLED